MFHSPFLFCLLIRNLLFRCWAGFLHLFFSCCFLGGWLEELVSWLQHLPMSLWMEWRWPFSTKVVFYLVLFFLQIILFSHLTSWSGHCVLCWRFSLDICYSLCAQIYKASGKLCLWVGLAAWNLYQNNTVCRAVLFCSYANRILAWPLVFCFFCDLGLWYEWTYSLHSKNQWFLCVCATLCSPPTPKTFFSKTEVSDFLGIQEGHCVPVLPLCLSHQCF